MFRIWLHVLSECWATLLLPAVTRSKCAVRSWAHLSTDCHLNTDALLRQQKRGTTLAPPANAYGGLELAPDFNHKPAQAQQFVLDNICFAPLTLQL